MSNYRALAFHPTSGRLEVATWNDTRAGYKVHFTDGMLVPEDSLWRPDEIDDPVALFEIAQEMAGALGRAPCVVGHRSKTARCASWRPQTEGEGCKSCRSLTRWREFTNPKETKDG